MPASEEMLQLASLSLPFVALGRPDSFCSFYHFLPRADMPLNLSTASVMHWAT